MSSNFQLQGCQMDLNTFIKLSPATLNVFDSVRPHPHDPCDDPL